MTSSALLTLLHTELELIEHFVFTLEKEHETLLSSYSNDELFDLTEIKNHYAERLDSAAQQREQLLQQLNLPAGRPGLLEARLLDPALAKAVDTLLALAEQAKALNEKNGVLIHAYLNYTTEALSAFGQSSAAPAQDVYDAQGKKQTGLAARRGYIQA
ncbi:hypothetical protein PAEH1_13240 [Paenalcaligenes hominis]|uniref:Flagellar biosynthesis protein FlgN n=1 Tax=Paenalcaligenes hominis TaxID=643674 RepID=A0A1U9K2I2_9BURK|nr:flagellar protein FlgN [Paenalcaligenes hominis]AQS50334.1 hypothetical protein PAEH1_00075 [Paenalcaligenes hominis]AQS52250.1 hypothetical protein PAEH1_13240 [Paenalcaligenes hominis]